MLKSQITRIYPNNDQRQIISCHIGGVRYVYNRALALRKFAYKRYGMKVSAFTLMKHFVRLKKRESTSWLKEIDSQSIKQSILNMDKAYQSFFKGGGYPKFKSKHRLKQSYQYPQSVKIDGNKIYLPKVGWMKCRGLRKDFEGKIKTVTVSLRAGKYYASVMVDLGDHEITPTHNSKAIGIDVGVSLMLADSEGNRVKPLNLDKDNSILKRRSQQLSNKKRGSNNRKKAKEKLAKQHVNIANKRKDFLHKLSALYSENQTVVVEDLDIESMTSKATGIKDDTINVVAKKILNRVIRQQGWGMFFVMLEYKLKERGGELIKVDPKYTSLTCSECGCIDKGSRRSQEEFVCISCGHSANADVNASKNILARGLEDVVLE